MNVLYNFINHKISGIFSIIYYITLFHIEFEQTANGLNRKMAAYRLSTPLYLHMSWTIEAETVPDSAQPFFYFYHGHIAFI